MGHDVFISYSSLDKPAADAVCHGLEAKGIRCWIAPRDQVAGQPFGQQITAAISESQVMVLVFSDNVNKSHAVHNEVGIAASANVTIVPFRIASVDFNSELNFYLGRMHWLDAFPQPVDHYIDNLVATVRRNITRNSGSETPAPGVVLPLSPPPPPPPPPAAALAAAAPPPPAPVPPRKRRGFWGWFWIVVAVLILLVVVQNLFRSQVRSLISIPPVTVKGNDGTTVTVGGGGVTVVDANAIAAPSAPPKSGSPPDAKAVRYYENVLVPGGPPQEIEDASVIDTAKLAERLRDRAAGKRAFILIDTRGCKTKQSIPGAFCLDPTNLAEFQAKIPDKESPVVLFCDDGRCPSAYALAQQAAAGGYESIDWYRGGANAWISSGGAVAPVTPVAK
jgi:rhodanese-related sulfurtransferase